MMPASAPSARSVGELRSRALRVAGSSLGWVALAGLIALAILHSDQRQALLGGIGRERSMPLWHWP